MQDEIEGEFGGDVYMRGMLVLATYDGDGMRGRKPSGV